MRDITLDDLLRVVRDDGAVYLVEEQTSLCECIWVTVTGRATTMVNCIVYTTDSVGLRSEATRCRVMPDEAEKTFTVSFCFDPVSYGVYRDAISFSVEIPDPVGDVSIESFLMCEKNEDSAGEPVHRSLVTERDGEKVVPVTLLDGSVVYRPLTAHRVLFIGNSILLGMRNSYGMCAGSPRNDYYYYLTQRFRELDPDSEFKKLHGAGLEHSESRQMYEEWMYSTPNIYTGVPAAESFTPDLDLIIMQLGDNAGTEEKRRVFCENADAFIRHAKTVCPLARIIWVYGWYNRPYLDQNLIPLLDKWGIESVQVGTLRTNKANEAYSGMLFEELSGKVNVVADRWITHPGNMGMKRIAEHMLKLLDM